MSVLSEINCPFWANAEKYSDLAAIADFNNWRFALPAVPLADIPTADPEALCIKRPATAQEFFNFTAASTTARTYTDAAGVLRNDLSVDQLRRDWIHGRLQLALNSARTNFIRNNTSQGVVSGIIGSVGVVPTFNVFTASPSFTREIVGSGVENGIEYVDYRVYGTSPGGSTVAMNITFDSTGNPATSVSDRAFSVFLKRTSGTIPAPGIDLVIEQVDSLGLNPVNITKPITIDNTLKRYFLAQALTKPDVATIKCSVWVYNPPTVGQPVDFTIRMGLAQLENFTSMLPVIKTVNASVARTIETARFSLTNEALVKRPQASVIVKGKNLSGQSAGIITTHRNDGNRQLLRSSLNFQSIFMGSESGIEIQSLNAASLMNNNSWAVAAAFDNVGRDVIRNGGPIGSDNNQVPLRNEVYLARKSTNYGEGWYDWVGIAPTRLSNARLTELAVPVT